MSRALRSTLAAGAGIAAAGLAWGLTEAHLFTLRRVSVPVLPVGAAPITVLHLSDIHLVTCQKTKLAWIASLAELRPDLVVNTGDNITSPQGMEPLLEAFGELLDVPGVFVWGSNDYHAPYFKSPLRYLTPDSRQGRTVETPELPWQELGARFSARGWVELTHRRTQLEINGTRIEFRGTDDAHLDKDDYSQVAGAPAPEADLAVGVTHAPYLRLLDAMTADGLDLLMAGHTHGGQVCLPWTALTTNCDLDTGRVKGLHQHSHGGQTAWLHVSGGLGTSPFAPYRICCRPEATLLTLLPRPA